MLARTTSVIAATVLTTFTLAPQATAEKTVTIFGKTFQDYAKMVSWSNCDRLKGDELKHLASMKSLKTLFLNTINVTDAGLKPLQSLKQLEKLYLTDTKVSDAGLKHLQGLTKLTELILNKTKVTDATTAVFTSQTRPDETDVIGAGFILRGLPS